MLHRAILGTLERFIGLLLEHHAGKLPLWLAPTQVAVLNVSEKSRSYAQQVANRLASLGIRVAADLHDRKVSYKIRHHTLAKVPCIWVVGGRDENDGTVAVRSVENGEPRVATMRHISPGRTTKPVR